MSPQPVSNEIGAMRPITFAVIRHVDLPHVKSDTPIGEGVVFSDGTVAMRWFFLSRSLSFYESVDDLREYACVNGRAYLDWGDNHARL